MINRFAERHPYLLLVGFFTLLLLPAVLGLD